MYSCQPSFIRLKITRYVNFTKKGQLILWVLDLIFFFLCIILLLTKMYARMIPLVIYSCRRD